MWSIIKIEENNFHNLKNSFFEKLGNETQFYIPKAKIQVYKNNALKNKTINILGDYIFCFNEKLSDPRIIQTLSYTRGLKYFLGGFKLSQKEIEYFISRCKNLEDKSGFIKHNLFDLKINEFYKFYNGPFSQNIFKLIELQKNKIKILIGNIKTTLRKKNLFVTPV